MTARVIQFNPSPERRERPTADQPTPAMIRPVHGWDANAVVSLIIDETFPPAHANVRWLIRIDPLRRRWEVEVIREGWQHSATFQGDDNITLWLLNQLLSTSYGVPA